MSRPRPGFKHEGQFKKGFDARRGTKGRGPGSKDRTGRDVWLYLQKRGDRDPLEFLSEAMSSELVDMPLRLQAAAHVSQYKYGKRAALHWISDIPNFKAPANVAEATNSLAYVTALMAEGRIDVGAGQALRDTLLAYISARTSTDTEERLRVLEMQAAEIMLRAAATATPVGGLPIMPGLEGVRFPQFGPPTIEHDKPNPWAPPVNADAGAVPEAAPRKRGRPRKRRESEPEEMQPSAPKTDPEPSEGD
jgi:hypothetical protein